MRQLVSLAGIIGLGMLGCGAGFAAAPQAAAGWLPVGKMLLHAAVQGYLGVTLGDVDADRAQALHLKAARGAEVIFVDRDAPAHQAGLQPHDVIVEMNGRSVDTQDQLRHMLHDTLAGHTVTLAVMREGQMQSFTVKLADEAQVRQRAWSRHFSVPDPDSDTGPQRVPGVATGFVSSAPADGSSHRFGSSLLGVFTPGGLYVGAEVDPITPQLADYFGVKSNTGLLVCSVDDNSPAAIAGLRAGDVITRVSGDAVNSRNEWMKLLHTHKGQQVQVTIVRNRREQNISMQAGEQKKHGRLVLPGSPFTGAPALDAGDAVISPEPVRVNLVEQAQLQVFRLAKISQQQVQFLEQAPQ